LAERLAPADDAAIIDVDRVRAALPEYAELMEQVPERAAELTHREASGIAMLALAWALNRGHHVVFDGVGADDEGQFTERITATLKQGAAVRVCYATVPVEEALLREAKRFAETGRRVPAEVLRTKHAAVSRGIASVARLRVELIEVYDTSGAEPRLLARGPGGNGLVGLEAVDPEGYAAFLSKGDA
jgi:predicted ABC-type ATPase